MQDWYMSWAEPGLAGSTVAAGERGEDDDRLRLSDAGKLVRRARRQVVRAARADDRPTFAAILAEHLQVPTGDLDVVEETWPAYDHVNVQIGLEHWLAAAGREHRLVGMTRYRHRDFALTDLLHGSPEDFGPVPGNVGWVHLAAGPDGEHRPAVRAGLFLVTGDLPAGATRAALLLIGPDPESGMAGVQVQVVADRPDAAGEIAAEVRRLALEHNVFRGQVISFGEDMFGERATALQFHTRPSMTEDDLVLPPETLAAMRRQVVGVAEHRERLLAARQHLKRGLLLYGPPGAGKTHSVRYLTSRLSDATVLVLTGASLQFISTACSVARSLQPAMVVVEDVDLIAEDRGMHPGRHPLLFQLLNEMDGLAEDADVVFVLTTNRADVLEPALASRPGRVDQAVAVALPGADARRRLFRLYRGDLDVDESRLDSVVERTDGVTASFLKELLRRAALLAAESADPPDADGPAASGEPPDGALRVDADHLDRALDELLDTRNAMTRSLLGAGRGEDA